MKKVIIDGVEYNLDLDKALETKVLHKVTPYCKSWEEYRNKYRSVNTYHIDVDYLTINTVKDSLRVGGADQNSVSRLATFIRLTFLRWDWIHNCGESTNQRDLKWCIYKYKGELTISELIHSSRPMSFPTYELAEEFLNTFEKALIFSSQFL